MQLVLKKKKKIPNGAWENCEWYIRNAKKEKILHTRNMDTWLLLYPTTKAWVSLKFYTTITLNIQFLNVFTEPAMHYRGAFHLCLKKKKKKSGEQSKIKGLKCFRTMLVVCPYTIVKPAASAAPHRAQYCSHSQVGGQQRWRSSCVCVQRRNDRETWRTSGGGKEDKASRFYVCACFFLKSSKSKPQLKMYICQSWANSDIKCHRARWNTDEVPPRFPRLFLNRCCGLLLYYTSSAERHKKGIKFPPNKLSEKTV